MCVCEYVHFNPHMQISAPRLRKGRESASECVCSMTHTILSLKLKGQRRVLSFSVCLCHRLCVFNFQICISVRIPCIPETERGGGGGRVPRRKNAVFCSHLVSVPTSRLEAGKNAKAEVPTHTQCVHTGEN